MADQVADYLRSQQIPDSVRADAWDAYHQATDANDFQSRFTKLQVPDNVKADLWDMRFAAQPQRRVTNVPTGEIRADDSWMSGARRMVANTALGHALQSSMPKVADFFGLTPSHTVYDPEYEATKGQLLAPQELIAASQPDSVMGYVKDAARAGLGGVGSLTSGENMATMAGIATGGGALAEVYFGSEMLIGADQGLKRSYQAASRGDYHTAAAEFGAAATNLELGRRTLRHLAGAETHSPMPGTNLVAPENGNGVSSPASVPAAPEVLAPKPKVPEPPLVPEGSEQPAPQVSAPPPAPEVSARPVFKGSDIASRLDTIERSLPGEVPEAKPKALPQNGSLEDEPNYLKRPLSVDPATGERKVIRDSYPEDMAARGKKKFDFYTDANKQIENAAKYNPQGEQIGDAKILAAYRENQANAVAGFRTWAQYADIEDVKGAVKDLAAKIKDGGERLDMMRVLGYGLSKDKLVFHAGIEGTEQITEDALQKAIGRRTVPSVPKDYTIEDPIKKDMVDKGLARQKDVDALDEQIDKLKETYKKATSLDEKQSISDHIDALREQRKAPFKEVKDAKATLRRDWASNYIRSKGLELSDQIAHYRDLAQAAIRAKQLRPKDFVEEVKTDVAPIRQLGTGEEAVQYSKESIAGAVFGSEADARKAAEQVYGDKYTLRTREREGKQVYSVLPREEVARQVTAQSTGDIAARKQNLDFLKKELTKATTEKARLKLQRAIAKEERALGLSASEAPTGPTAATAGTPKAPEAAAPTRESVQAPQGTEVRPSFDERMKARTEVKDDIFEYRVQQLVKKGMSRATAELMVRKKMESERGSFSNKPPMGAYGPSGPGVLWRLGSALDRVFGDRSSEEKKQTETIIREAGGELARKHEMIWNKLQEGIDRHDADTEVQTRQFMDAGEMKPGATVLSPEDQAMAQELHSMFQERWDKLKNLLPDRFDGAGIENYLKHIWEGKRGQVAAERLWQSVGGKRPLEGSATFARHRFYRYFSDGLDAGLKPLTYNPIKMQLLGLYEIDRFIMAHEMKNDMRQAGLVKFVKIGQDVPPGWSKLDDKIFKPRLFKDGGLTSYGEYWAPADVAKVFNNYLSPGLRSNEAYEIARQYGNFMNQIQLGASAFHGGFEVVNASSSEVALGLQQLTRGQYADGMKRIARGYAVGLAAKHYYSLGKAIEQEYIAPTGITPNNIKLVEAVRELEIAGGRIGLDPIYSNQSFDAMRKAWTEGRYIASGAHALGHAVEYTARPLMKYFVPRIKLGMFADMAQHRLTELINQGATRDEIAHELGKVWDSVDNRAGQLVYDNLFWNKATKDIGFLAVRSLGWTLGTVRELGGAGVDTFRQASDLLKGNGKNIRLTERQAYAIGMTTTVGLIGGIMTYLATGKAPQKAEDYFFPPTGTLDPSGNPARRSLPSYVRDVAAFKNQPLQTITNKAQPLLVDIHQLWTNQDYYGTEIRHPGDSTLAQVGEVAKHELTNLQPFGIQSYMRSRHSAESRLDSALSFVGVTPAPRYIGQTKAEKLAYELSERHREAGPRDANTFQKYRTAGQLRALYAAGKIDESKLDDALFSGKITDSQYNDIVDATQMTPFERQVKSLKTPEEIMTVWREANPSERATMHDYMEGMWDRIDPDTQPELFKQFEKELGYEQ